MSDEREWRSWRNTRLDGLKGAAIYTSNKANEIKAEINIITPGEYFYSEDWTSSPESNICTKTRLSILPKANNLFIRMHDTELSINHIDSYWALQVFIPKGKYLITEIDLVNKKLDYKIGDIPNG